MGLIDPMSAFNETLETRPVRFQHGNHLPVRYTVGVLTNLVRATLVPCEVSLKADRTPEVLDAGNKRNR